MDWKFIYVVDVVVCIVIKNIFFFFFGLGCSKLSSLIMFWVIYIDLEIVYVGLNEIMVEVLDIGYKIIKIFFFQVDWAIVVDEIEGFLKIIYVVNSDEILGVIIVVFYVGEMIFEIIMVIVNKIGLSKLVGVIYFYFIQVEVIKKVVDIYCCILFINNMKNLLKFLIKFFSKLFQKIWLKILKLYLI